MEPSGFATLRLIIRSPHPVRNGKTARTRRISLRLHARCRGRLSYTAAQQAEKPGSFYNLVCKREHVVRHGEAHRLRGFQVDDKQITRRNLNGRSAGFAPWKMRAASAAARSKDS